MKFGGEKPKAKIELKDEQLTGADKIEVLQNLNISEKNLEFTQKMAQIEEELKKRKYVTGMNHDTGKENLSKESYFDKNKENFSEIIKNNLTHESKYIKGSVITGLVAAGLLAGVGAYLNNQGIALRTFEHSEGLNYIKDLFLNLEDGVPLTMAAVAGIGALGTSIVSGIKGIKQSIKNKMATNQAMQRFTALIAGGVKETVAFENVAGEASERIGYNQNISFPQGTKSTNVQLRTPLNSGAEHRMSINYEDFESLKQAREKLDEMGVERIDRAEYAADKNDIKTFEI